MKLFVRFTDKPQVRVPLNMKVLGEAWEENKDFYISINREIKDIEKLETFIEEAMHLFIRVVGFFTKKNISVKTEHAIIKGVIEVFKKYGLIG